MFVIDLLLLALSAVIFPDPGMERVFIHAKIARCLSNRLLRLDREFDCAFLKFSGILCRRGLTHRTHLICCVVSVSPCVRKSIATSGLQCRTAVWRDKRAHSQSFFSDP